MTRGFEQTVSSDTDFLRWNAKAHDVAHFSRLQQFTEIELLLEICHSAFHQSQIAGESQPVCVEQQVKHNWTLPRYGFARKLFRDSRSLLRPGVFTAHRENQRHELQQVDIGSIDVCEETCTTIRRFDPLRHMDDVVGTGPQEHLMNDFEHMKTSLHLTDVVVSSLAFLERMSINICSQG